MTANESVSNSTGSLTSTAQDRRFTYVKSLKKGEPLGRIKGDIASFQLLDSRRFSVYNPISRKMKEYGGMELERMSDLEAELHFNKQFDTITMHSYKSMLTQFQRTRTRRIYSSPLFIEKEGQHCYRCGGSGYISTFRHVLNGVCFRCNGSGK